MRYYIYYNKPICSVNVCERMFTNPLSAFKLFLVSLIILMTMCNCSDTKCRRARNMSNTDSCSSSSSAVCADACDFKPTVNVYIENSGSMDGYVKGQTEFETIVYNYLVDLKLAEATVGLNLFYINSKLLPQQDDVHDFIEKLEPNSFSAKGGDRGTSDISQMIEMIMNEMNDSIVSIFISDCIFSPGRGKDAGEYLNNQQIGIKNVVGQYFNNHPNLAVIGYRCVSSFNGNYYDKNNKGKLFEGKRPFYVWLLGTQHALKCVQNKMSNSRYQLDGVENDFVVFGSGDTMPDSCYAVKRNSGKFDLKRGDSKHSIEDLEADKNGKVRFSVEVDFTPYILSDAYLCDASMYRLNDTKYRVVSVERIKNHNKYSHIINIEADKVHPTTLEIQLSTSQPTWPEYYNDDEGGKITSSNSEKTYGIKYMTNGIAQAIIRKEYYTRMTININK